MSTLYTRHRTASRGSSGLWLLAWILTTLVMLLWGQELMDFVKGWL